MKPKEMKPKKITKPRKSKPFEPWTPEKQRSLKILARVYYDYQKERISLDGRLSLKKDGEHKKTYIDRDETYLVELINRREEVLKYEESTIKIIEKEVHKHPLWTSFLKHVNGVGPAMSVVILTEYDIRKAPAASNLISFGGIATGKTKGKIKRNGKIIVTNDLIDIDRKTKGYLCPYNSKLKPKLCGVLGPSLIKHPNPYREIYLNRRHRRELQNWGKDNPNPTDPKKPKASHQHNDAIRYTVKQFLIALYVAWRTLEGLEVRDPYEKEYLNKIHHTKLQNNSPEKNEPNKKIAGQKPEEKLIV